MSIPPVGGLTTPPVLPTLPGADAPAAAPATGQELAADFGAMLSGQISALQDLHTTSDQLARAAATGDLTDVHDYTIASTQAAVATELTVAVRNRAVEAFTEIMRMQI
ncbi:MAG: flagellar hook-basal body complex protein FliE [Dietzia sp.]|uniref:flagellar hook-basal body complex protein FliE n=1 Tax=Quadrisphaera sp. GCM10027208 TaxID=3273423 RepID=UPI00198DE36B|nr:flagellar hook-basal body complex protein FliE [Dietzia sp.]UER53545.1 flagellar hook-basal body complex protein FliE [Kineosporiaceae bacterium SCSIO 59966]